MELAWMLCWYFRTGDFTPYKWTGFAGSFAFVVGMIFLLSAIVVDMLRMMRLNSEKILYFSKRNYYESLHNQKPTPFS